MTFVYSVCYNDICKYSFSERWGDFMSDVELRIEELTKILNDANYSYYVNANSIITDQ